MAQEYGCTYNTKYGCDIYGKDITSNSDPRVVFGVWKLRASSYASALLSVSAMLQFVVY